MSEHKLKKQQPQRSERFTETIDEKVATERSTNAQPHFFLRSAVWLLSRFPLTRNRYQNWTSGRRILVGWILWIILLPIIPVVVLVLWYMRDPEGFKKSPLAKALIGITVIWAGYFGLVATNPAQLDVNGKYSPVQTQPDGEKSGSSDNINTPSNTAKDKVRDLATSKDTQGRYFENCTVAFEAGVFNIKRSNDSYRPALDRDSDGIACEK